MLQCCQHLFFGQFKPIQESCRCDLKQILINVLNFILFISAVTCFSVTLIGYLLLDMAVFFYYPLRLVTRCSLSDFNGIMRKCRTKNFNKMRFECTA